jgi:hypothetical protein
LVLLPGSRYCEGDRLSETAWSRFGKTLLGCGRVQAIGDYVQQHIAFGHGTRTASRTAREAFCDGTGVCPSRGRVVSLHDHPGAILHRLSRLHRRAGYGRADGFAAEAYLGGEWYAVDARNKTPRIGPVLTAPVAMAAESRSAGVLVGTRLAASRYGPKKSQR